MAGIKRAEPRPAQEKHELRWFFDRKLIDGKVFRFRRVGECMAWHGGGEVMPKPGE
jgi:hypothetical protein